MDQTRINELKAELAALEGQQYVRSEPETQAYREPTHDFVNYRLERIWNKMPEPKPSWDKWLLTEGRVRTAKHDSAVQDGLDALDRDYRDEFDRWALRVIRGLYFSWGWHHASLSDGRLDSKDYDLLGQN